VGGFDAAAELESTAGAFAASVAGVSAEPGTGVDAPLDPLTGAVLDGPTDGVGRCELLLLPAVAAGATRLAIRVRRLLSSEARSFMRASWEDLCASSALGIKSLRDRSSSALRRASSSRLCSASFSAAITDSNSVSAESSRDVRASSASLRTFVSVSSCSKAVKALEKEVSIDSLSCVSCGGVGGLISGSI
jgi:hypothetical protein